MNNVILSLISLSMKAGKLKSGEIASKYAIKNKIAKLIIIPIDASNNIKKKFINLSKYYKLPYLIFEYKNILGHIIGKQLCSILIICDDGFAKLILSKIKT